MAFSNKFYGDYKSLPECSARGMGFVVCSVLTKFYRAFILKELSTETITELILLTLLLIVFIVSLCTTIYYLSKWIRSFLKNYVKNIDTLIEIKEMEEPEPEIVMEKAEIEENRKMRSKIPLKVKTFSTPIKDISNSNFYGPENGNNSNDDNAFSGYLQRRNTSFDVDYVKGKTMGTFQAKNKVNGRLNKTK